jgi:hypothetical protein
MTIFGSHTTPIFECREAHVAVHHQRLSNYSPVSIRHLSVTTIIARHEELREETRLRLYGSPRSLAGYGLGRQILLWLAHSRLRRPRWHVFVPPRPASA